MGYRNKYNLDDIKGTIWCYRPIQQIIEAVVTNNMGYLNEPPQKADITDKYQFEYKWHLNRMEDKQVIPDWEKSRRLPVLAKMECYILNLVAGPVPRGSRRRNK